MSLEYKHIPYDLAACDPKSAFYETYWKEVALSVLRKHADVTGKTILDYGCGRGESLGFYREVGMKATGADLDPECVRISSTESEAVLLQSTRPLETFAPKSFDVVSCFHVLEHVENPKEVLTQLGQIAREYVLVAVPNLQRLERIHKRYIDPDLINEGHLQAWDHWHFVTLAQKHCGLELVEWGFDVTLLPVASQLLKKVFGWKAAVSLEKGLFRKIFPYQCLSIIGLFRHRNPAG